MAWRSLQQWFLRFRKSYYPDVIVLYKNYLYDEWFNSLSEEEQQKENERQRLLKEKRKRDGEMALARLAYMTSEMRRIASKNIDGPISYWDMMNTLF